jgi:hypothetical protein
MVIFRDIPNSEGLSYVVDVNAIPGGQRVIPQIPSRRPVDRDIPTPAHCALQQGLAREL